MIGILYRRLPNDDEYLNRIIRSDIIPKLYPKIFELSQIDNKITFASTLIQNFFNGIKTEFPKDLTEKTHPLYKVFKDQTDFILKISNIKNMIKNTIIMD